MRQLKAKVDADNLNYFCVGDNCLNLFHCTEITAAVESTVLSIFMEHFI